MRCLIAAALVSAVLPAYAVEPDAPPRLIDASEAFTITLVNTVEQRARAGKPAHKRIYDGIAAYYRQTGGRPVWIADGGFTSAVDGLRKAISRAETFALSPADYSVPNAIPAANPAYPRDGVAAAEVDVSIAAVLYATHASAGRLTPSDVDPNFDPSPDIPNPTAVLAAARENPDGVQAQLESYHPKHPQFLALLAELNNPGSAIKTQAPLPAYGPALKLGMTHPDVAVIRQRLRVPVPPGGTADTFDETLSAKLKDYQKEHGWRPDGVVNVMVRQAMQVPPPPTRKMLLANIERWRWMPRDLGSTHIRINLPEYLVRIIRNGEETFRERVVIGSTGYQTPIFSNRMRTVVINPYWNIPASIAENEILPLVQRDPGYLSRNGMEALVNGYGGTPVAASEIDWSNVDAADVVLRQVPGPGNSLGELKFLFPNRHNVYLHDTPQKYLFNEVNRPFSHGCMRVRNPRRLAEAVLGWSPERVQEAIAKGGPNQEVPVEPRLPVHVMYFTVWVDADGTVQTFRDVYGHDRKVADALDGRILSAENRSPQENY
jgi:murein L,D-transpeptidase YcbB/YkuD